MTETDTTTPQATPAEKAPAATGLQTYVNPQGETVQAMNLDELLDLDIAGWRPNDGDKITGRVVNIELAGQGSTFGSYPLLVIVRDDTGELVNVHAFHTVLRTELGRKSVGVGDRIGIKYLGLKDGGDFGKYENYRVIVQASDPVRLSAERVGRANG